MDIIPHDVIVVDRVLTKYADVISWSWVDLDTTYIVQKLAIIEKCVALGMEIRYTVTEVTLLRLWQEIHFRDSQQDWCSFKWIVRCHALFTSTTHSLFSHLLTRHVPSEWREITSSLASHLPRPHIRWDRFDCLWQRFCICGKSSFNFIFSINGNWLHCKETYLFLHVSSDSSSACCRFCGWSRPSRM